MQSNTPLKQPPWAANRIRRWSLFLIIALAGMWGAAALPSGSHRALAKSSSAILEHRVVILVDSDDEKIMGHAISYSINITRSYAMKNESVKIEIVANGSGIKLFRADTSPLQQPLAALRQAIPGIVFSMCDSSKQIAEQKEGHSIDLVAGARLVPFGIGRVVELEESGWSYIHG
jgi:intracellular sulfur oxidation DsrE/DsrF family protein